MNDLLTETEFDDIRPYRDAEVAEAMQRIADSRWLSQLAAFVFPDLNVEEVARLLRQIDTTKAFQRRVMYHFNEQVMRRSIEHFSCNGLQRLDSSHPYLFVSNHRDIVLDASLLQNALVDHGFETSEITFGANLMCDPLVIDIGRSNKMFRVERGGDAREFYRSSLHLSRYIRHVITQKRASVWIAQRNGRTKDGIDQTEQGLIKMFMQSADDEKVASLAALNIVPVAVSYEWEPCDLLKAAEMARSRHGKYVKQPGEDIHSILTGINQQKGKVHFEVCPPLTSEELSPLSALPLNEATRRIAELIDRRIIEAYRLMPTHRLAYSMLHPEEKTNWVADEELKEILIGRMQTLEEAEMRDIFLQIYAHPVVSKLKFSYPLS